MSNHVAYNAVVAELKANLKNDRYADKIYFNSIVVNYRNFKTYCTMCSSYTIWNFQKGYNTHISLPKRYEFTSSRHIMDKSYNYSIDHVIRKCRPTDIVDLVNIIIEYALCEQKYSRWPRPLQPHDWNCANWYDR